MTPEQGYVGQQPSLPDLIGRTGTVTAVLRPSGKVLVDGTYYEAVAEDGLYIERGAVVEIVRAEGGLLYCRRPQGRLDRVASDRGRSSKNMLFLDYVVGCLIKKR